MFLNLLSAPREPAVRNHLREAAGTTWYHPAQGGTCWSPRGPRGQAAPPGGRPEVRHPAGRSEDTKTLQQTTYYSPTGPEVLASDPPENPVTCEQRGSDPALLQG